MCVYNYCTYLVLPRACESREGRKSKQLVYRLCTSILNIQRGPAFTMTQYICLVNPWYYSMAVLEITATSFFFPFACPLANYGSSIRPCLYYKRVVSSPSHPLTLYCVLLVLTQVVTVQCHVHPTLIGGKLSLVTDIWCSISTFSEIVYFYMCM